MTEKTEKTKKLIEIIEMLKTEIETDIDKTLCFQSEKIRQFEYLIRETKKSLGEMWGIIRFDETDFSMVTDFEIYNGRNIGLGYGGHNDNDMYELEKIGENVMGYEIV